MRNKVSDSGTSFALMAAAELVVVLAVFVVAIIAVKANAISLQDLQEYFG